MDWRSFVGLGAFAFFLDNEVCYNLNEKLIIIPWLIVVFLVIFYLISFLSSDITSKHDSIIEIEEATIEDIPSVMDVSIMEKETAKIIGSRVMEEIDDVSQYNINNEYNMIVYQGETYMVSPLEYASSSKALENNGISGYVLINCASQEARLVKLDKKMKYVPSAVLGYDLKRHIRKSYSSALLGEFQFEINEEGNPFYIVPVYKTTVGLYSGLVVERVLVVNPINGEIDEYTKKNVPNWIDHTDSISHLTKLAEFKIILKDGYTNYFISNNSVKILPYCYRSTTENFEGYSSIRTEYVACVTYGDNEESKLGFLFINPKTGTIKMCNCVGAEASSVMERTEELEHNYGYVSTYPFIVNVDGIETFLMALKDKTGINKAYALVNAKDYTISTQAASKNEAIKQYSDMINKKGVNVDNTNKTEESVKKGKITDTLLVGSRYYSIRYIFLRLYFRDI